MDQYFQVVNVDKKESIHPTFFNGIGISLMNWAYNDNPVTLTMMNLMAGRWKGDRVFAIGDYACDDNPQDPYVPALASAMKDLNTTSLYSWAYENCSFVVPHDFDRSRHLRYLSDSAQICEEFADFSDKGWNYIVNHQLEQFIDLKHCPVTLIYQDPRTRLFHNRCVAPLPLLLAMGNGRGTGDYNDIYPGHEYVGTWCDSVSSIELCKSLEESATHYREFFPGFAEPRIKEYVS